MPAVSAGFGFRTGRFRNGRDFGRALLLPYPNPAIAALSTRLKFGRTV